MPATHGAVRTFLIADIRGYTRFTEEYGDQAAARLAAKFADLVRDGVEIRGGELVELRGDEALAVFESTRQAIRAAMDLQGMFSHETDADADLPLRVGIGIDSGEAVQVEDGYRGGALNVAARLCALAHGGEVLTSAGSARLAGRLPGLRYVDRGEANLKGIDGPTHVMRVAWEDEKQRPWVFLFQSPSRRTGWRLGALAALVAALTAVLVVYLTGGDSSKVPEAAARTTQGATTSQEQATTAQTTTSTSVPAASANVLALIPAHLRRHCKLQAVADPGALQTAVCLQPPPGPDRWQLSTYPNDPTPIRTRYEAIRKTLHIAPDQGECSALSWGGEAKWAHGPGKPGGRRLCYFEGDDAVIVWTHERFDQADHRNVLGIAREGGSDHSILFQWWNYWHHRVGKVNG